MVYAYIVHIYNAKRRFSPKSVFAVDSGTKASVFERKLGRRLGVLPVEVKNDQGKLIADSLFTVAFADQA